MTEETGALLHLNRFSGLGPLGIAKLCRVFGSAGEALSRSAWEWEIACGIEPEFARLLLSPRERDFSLREQETAQKEEIWILSWNDPNYPSALREIDASPPILYAQGNKDLLREKKLLFSIVGSRTPTSYGKVQAERFSGTLAAAGCVIVSGLARGIDDAAHRAALDNGTLAVLGCGLHRLGTKGDFRFLEKMKSQGLLLSEFPLDEPAWKSSFPRRNRILSGLSRGVLVVEAAEKSGSLITARWAIDQGREVFALPGRVDNPMSRGCHALLKEGCHLVESPQDILKLLGVDVLGMPGPSENWQRDLLQALGEGMKTLDELSGDLQKAPEKLLEELLELEIAGWVQRGPGGIYRRSLKVGP